MATTARELQRPEQDLLSSYLRALAREGGSHDVELDGGRQLRTCPSCGHRAVFRPEPLGTWYTCTDCGRYA